MTVISKTVKEVMAKHGGKHGGMQNPPSIGCMIPFSFHLPPKAIGDYVFGNLITALPIRLKLVDGLATSIKKVSNDLLALKDRIIVVFASDLNLRILTTLFPVH